MRLTLEGRSYCDAHQKRRQRSRSLARPLGVYRLSRREALIRFGREFAKAKTPSEKQRALWRVSAVLDRWGAK